MAKKIPPQYKALIGVIDATYTGLNSLHRQDAIGRDISCPTGNEETCPRCQTLRLLETDVLDAVAFLDKNGYDVGGVATSTNGSTDPDRPEKPDKRQGKLDLQPSEPTA